MKQQQISLTASLFVFYWNKFCKPSQHYHHLKASQLITYFWRKDLEQKYFKYKMKQVQTIKVILINLH